MQSTLRQQAEAIKRAMDARTKEFAQAWMVKNLAKYQQEDEQWKLLNDAYSTIISLQLNETLKQNNNEKRRSVFNGW